jgi:hypothetical protein
MCDTLVPPKLIGKPLSGLALHPYNSPYHEKALWKKEKEGKLGFPNRHSTFSSL